MRNTDAGSKMLRDIELNRLKQGSTSLAPVNESRAGGLLRKGLSFLIVFCLAAISFAAEPKDSAPPQKEKCPVCGMFVSMFPDWNARIEFKDSTHATFDGAKCMSKYYLNIKKYNPSKKQE